MNTERDRAVDLIERYYSAFNMGDRTAMLGCLTDDVAHDVNQGARRAGRAAFAAFLDHMDRCYAEQVADLVVMVNKDGTRAAAEFMVIGAYQQQDEGLPPAHGQTYRLAGGAFFEIRNHLIARVTTYYNLNDWIAQIEAK